MRATLVNAVITAAQGIAAVPDSVLQLVDAPSSIAVQANFAYGSGGTTVDAYLQTSFDYNPQNPAAATWIDIAEFHFTTSSARVAYNLNSQTPVTTQYTATDGALSANTAKDGIVGSVYQVKLVTIGTYAGNTTLRIDVSAQEP
jgi:predicted NAD/FAD-binding protein